MRNNNRITKPTIHIDIQILTLHLIGICFHLNISLLNIGCSITFSRFLGVGGIALATSVAMLVSVVLLMFKLKKYLPNYNVLSSYKEYLKGLLSTIVCSIIIFLIELEMHNSIIIKVLMESLICFGTYILCMALLKANCIRIMKTKILKR